LLATGVPGGDGGCSVAALFIRGSREKRCGTPVPLAVARLALTALLGSGADVP
jgi:hypothetical protein